VLIKLPVLSPIAIRKDPLVFVQDVTGFMVGSKSEQGGIIKDGAKW
jgi:acetyl-CoA carboxylase carboxyltransferase component